MAFERPTLQQLIDRAQADLRAELGLAAIVRRTFLSAFARVIAGAAHSNHGHLKKFQSRRSRTKRPAQSLNVGPLFMACQDDKRRLPT